MYSGHRSMDNRQTMWVCTWRTLKWRIYLQIVIASCPFMEVDYRLHEQTGKQWKFPSPQNCVPTLQQCTPITKCEWWSSAGLRVWHGSSYPSGHPGTCPYLGPGHVFSRWQCTEYMARCESKKSSRKQHSESQLGLNKPLGFFLEKANP